MARTREQTLIMIYTFEGNWNYIFLNKITSDLNVIEKRLIEFIEKYQLDELEVVLMVDCDEDKDLFEKFICSKEYKKIESKLKKIEIIDRLLFCKK